MLSAVRGIPVGDGLAGPEGFALVDTCALNEDAKVPLAMKFSKPPAPPDP